MYKCCHCEFILTKKVINGFNRRASTEEEQKYYLDNYNIPYLDAISYDYCPNCKGPIIIGWTYGGMMSTAVKMTRPPKD